MIKFSRIRLKEVLSGRKRTKRGGKTEQRQGEEEGNEARQNRVGKNKQKRNAIIPQQNKLFNCLVFYFPYY